MNSNEFFYDEKSRYNDVDNTKIIFLTPNQLEELNIGMDTSIFREDEMEEQFPFLLDSLEQMVKETTLGDVNGSEIELSVENSDTKVFICIEINGKLCKLQSEEWDITNNLYGMPKHTQIKVFQRLISTGQITLEDLAIEDIDNDVYKKLVVNESNGQELYEDKIEFLERIYMMQKFDKKLMKKVNAIIKNCR